MEIVLPNLKPYQKEIFDSEARFTITEASTKSGKTYSHMAWLFYKAHTLEDPVGKKVYWVAPVYSQCEIAFERYRKQLAPTGVYQFNKSSMRIICPNGAEIHFRSAEREDNLYGDDVYAAVFDEAPRASVNAWNALRSTLSSTEGPCKLIGNFGGVSNWVHKLKDNAKTDKEYEYFRITCWDAVKEGILSEKEVLQAKKDLHPKVFKELYEAEPSEDESQLITNEAIHKLFKGNIVDEGIHYITADVARLGKDKTVIMVWNGYRVVYIKTIISSELTAVGAEISRLASQYKVDKRKVIVDQDGLGAGVRDYLGCIGFINNSSAYNVRGEKQNFANYKTQCYWKLAEYINKGKIAVDCEPDIERALTEELEWVRLPSEIDTSKIKLMGKDQIKKNLGRSPDYSDALMLRMHFEVRPNFGVYDIR